MSGPAPTLDVLITREVRWFRAGRLPAEVAEWFTAAGSLGVHEHRVDVYESESARIGVGVKQRSSTSLDAKVLLRDTGEQRLLPGLEGRVQDWIKVSQPVDPTHANGGYVEVEKDIVTRRYVVDGRAGNGERGIAGCSVELAAVRFGDLEAWTLCFETFGPAGFRADALRAGVEGLSNETPLPESLQLTADASCGYPAWISRHLS